MVVSVIWAIVSDTRSSLSHLLTSSHIITMVSFTSQLSTLVLAASMALVMSAPAAQPGGLLDGLFKDAPLLGPLGGFGAGGLLAGLAGYKAKDSILNTINTIANVADAKIGLLNLGANLVGTGIDAVKEIRGEQPAYPSHNSYNYAPRYQGRYPRYNAYG